MKSTTNAISRKAGKGVEQVITPDKLSKTEQNEWKIRALKAASLLPKTYMPVWEYEYPEDKGKEDSIRQTLNARIVNIKLTQKAEALAEKVKNS
jgi:hypothetical protein